VGSARLSWSKSKKADLESRAFRSSSASRKGADILSLLAAFLLDGRNRTPWPASTRASDQAHWRPYLALSSRRLRARAWPYDARGGFAAFGGAVQTGGLCLRAASAPVARGASSLPARGWPWPRCWREAYGTASLPVGVWTKRYRHSDPERQAGVQHMLPRGRRPGGLQVKLLTCDSRPQNHGRWNRRPGVVGRGWLPECQVAPPAAPSFKGVAGKATRNTRHALVREARREAFGPTSARFDRFLPDHLTWVQGA